MNRDKAVNRDRIAGQEGAVSRGGMAGHQDGACYDQQDSQHETISSGEGVSKQDAHCDKDTCRDTQHIASAPEPLKITHIRVRPDRMEIKVAVSAENYAYTDQALMNEVLKSVPSVAQHTCRNAKGIRFCDVMNETSLPHLLEHLIVDAQARRSKNEDRIFTGTTQWSVDDRLVAQVSVSYEDDLVAFDVVNKSVAFLNRLLVQQRILPRRKDTT